MSVPSQTYSATERALQRALDVLAAAGTAAISVHRGRVDGHGITELPAINLRRSSSNHEAHGHGVERAVQEFEIDHLVSGDGWESACDALHAQAHAALCADAVLSSLVRGLRLTRIDVQADAADEVRATLTATYQFQALHATRDVTAGL